MLLLQTIQSEANKTEANSSAISLHKDIAK
jgi:hypothetical protein